MAKAVGLRLTTNLISSFVGHVLIFGTKLSFRCQLCDSFYTREFISCNKNIYSLLFILKIRLVTWINNENLC